MPLFAKISQLGGLVGDLIDAVANWLESWLFDYFLSPILQALLSFIYMNTIVPILTTTDIVYMLFKKFAGLGSYSVNGNLQQGDFVYSLVVSEAVMNVFWAMLILAVILLLITTFIAVIKSEFTAFHDKEGGNSKAKIIGKSIRALINFAVVPICAVLGMLIGNALLRTIDSATKGGPEVSMAGRLFILGAYDANRVRKCNLGDYAWDDMEVAKKYANNVYGREYDQLNEKQKKDLADYIDNMFATGGLGSLLSGGQLGNDAGENAAEVFDFLLNYSYLRVDGVIGCYDIVSFDFVMVYAAGIAVLVMMILIFIGLTKRVFGIVTLFVIAPPIVAITPLKPNALSDWNKEFIKHVLAAYSSIVGMNVFLLVTQALSSINFFPELGALGEIIPVNTIANFLIMVGGLVFVKGLTADIGKIIGGDSALNEGASKASDFVKTAGAIAGTIATAGAGAATMLGKGIKGFKGLGAKVKGAKGAAGGDGTESSNDSTTVTGSDTENPTNDPTTTNNGENKGLGAEVKSSGEKPSGEKPSSGASSKDDSNNEKPKVGVVKGTARFLGLGLGIGNWNLGGVLGTVADVAGMTDKDGNFIGKQSFLKGFKPYQDKKKAEKKEKEAQEKAKKQAEEESTRQMQENIAAMASMQQQQLNLQQQYFALPKKDPRRSEAAKKGWQTRRQNQAISSQVETPAPIDKRAAQSAARKAKENLTKVEISKYGHKISAKEPCPCGSGKTYEKCCRDINRRTEIK